MCMYDYNMMIFMFGQGPNKRFELELKKQRENRDFPFIMNQFTSLAFTMHEIYEFGKFENRHIQNKNESPSISNQPVINVYWKEEVS